MIHKTKKLSYYIPHVTALFLASAVGGSVLLSSNELPKELPKSSFLSLG